jgi:L-alanine-DL-glutamate epimerase-like enolase superfamily enzyme
VKKIAALAEAPSLGVLPHLMGSLVNAAASAQLDAASPNVVLQKGAHTATHHLNEIVDQLFTLEEGHTIVPGRPALGSRYWRIGCLVPRIGRPRFEAAFAVTVR